MQSQWVQLTVTFMDGGYQATPLTGVTETLCPVDA